MFSTAFQTHERAIGHRCPLWVLRIAVDTDLSDGRTYESNCSEQEDSPRMQDLSLYSQDGSEGRAKRARPLEKPY
jgi:hypothetical protein